MFANKQEFLTSWCHCIWWACPGMLKVNFGKKGPNVWYVEQNKISFNSALSITNLVSGKIFVLEFLPNFWSSRLQDSLKHNVSKKNQGIKLMFCLQINIRVSYKLALLLLVGVTSHAQSTQNNKFVISL